MHARISSLQSSGSLGTGETWFGVWKGLGRLGTHFSIIFDWVKVVSVCVGNMRDLLRAQTLFVHLRHFRVQGPKCSEKEKPSKWIVEHSEGYFGESRRNLGGILGESLGESRLMPLTWKRFGKAEPNECFPGHPTRQKTGASQKMDRSKKGPPEVPHREGALGDLRGTDF